MKVFKIRPKKWWSIRAWRNAKALEELDNYILSDVVFLGACPECNKDVLSYKFSAKYRFGVCLNCASIIQGGKNEVF